MREVTSTSRFTAGRGHYVPRIPAKLAHRNSGSKAAVAKASVGWAIPWVNGVAALLGELDFIETVAKSVSR